MAGTARADILHSGGFPDTGFYRLVNSLLIGFIGYILSFNCYEYVFFKEFTCAQLEGNQKKWFFFKRSQF